MEITDTIEVLPNGLSYEVPSDRVIFQFPVYSMLSPSSQIAMQYYLKQNGKILINLQTVDNQVPFADRGIKANNNHPACSSLVVSAGPLEVWYQNKSKLGKSIVFGVGKIIQETGVNNAYRFYQYQGLKTTPYFKQLNAGDAVKFDINIESVHYFGKVVESQSGSLHKAFNANLIVDGKLYIGEAEFTFGDGNYYPYDGIQIRNNSQITVKINPFGNRTKYVAVQINTLGIEQTGSVKVLEQHGVGIAPAHLRISAFSFNYINFSAVEGGEVLYKMFNNSGIVDKKTMSIKQLDNPETTMTTITTATEKSKKQPWWYLLIIGLIGILAWRWKRMKK